MSAILRLATNADADQIQAIYAPCVRDTVISFETEPPTEAEIRRRITTTLTRYPWLVCDRDGEIAGYVYASSHRERAAYQWSVEVTAYVHAAHRRTGVGHALYTSLFRLLALQGYYNAYAGIALPNPASIGLHESVGFQPVGIYHAVGYKHGAWHDVGWWECTLADRPDVAPEPPLSLDATSRHPSWEAAMGAGLPLLRSQRDRLR